MYVTGSFEGTVNFDSSSNSKHLLTSKGKSDVFVLKLDAKGTVTWVKNFGGVDCISQAGSIILDAFGDLIFTGTFKGKMDFDPNSGSIKLESGGEKDIFIIKLDTISSLKWVKRIGGKDFSSDNKAVLVADDSGELYLLGNFKGQLDYEVNLESKQLTSFKRAIRHGWVYSRDIFIQIYSREGNLKWIRKFGGIGDESWQMAHINSKGDMYLAGTVYGQLNLDPFGGEKLGGGDKGYGNFVLKIANMEFVNIEDVQSENINIYPNPSKGTIHIDYSKEVSIDEVSLLDITGKVVFLNKSIGPDMVIELDTISNGLYTISILLYSGERIYEKIVIRK